MYSDQTKHILDNIISFIFGCLIILFFNFMFPRPITVFIDNPNNSNNPNNPYNKKLNNCWNCKN